MLLLCGCIKTKTTKPTIEDEKKENIEENNSLKDEKQEKNNYVSYNGYLKVVGTNLKNGYDENMVLRGISSHGLQWYGDYINYDNLKELKENWGINVFRIAMYTEEGGYISNKGLKNKVIEIVNDAIKLDMYVIIDWHILSDNNPNIHLEEAKNFFKEMANLYKDVPNVIYEICNEPNGYVTWDNDIKPYAEEIIEEIRKIDEKAIIIVGTSTYSQDVDVTSKNPIGENNIMYALHFYAGTHKEDLRNKAKIALNNNLPLFVSEWGMSDASGNGGVYIDSSKEWLEFLDANNISWIVWSLCDKNESSALLKNGTNTKGIYDEEFLSESGKFIKQELKSKM